MSTPVYSGQVAGVVLNVVAVTYRGATQLQLYACESEQRWELVGMYSAPERAAAARPNRVGSPAILRTRA
jgi:hypothetical protein